MFKNLYFLRDPAFRNHNFSDFWNAPGGGGGDPIEQISDEAIAGYIRRSYLPDSVMPGRAEGFPPDFHPILPVTLSRPSCESFIRAYLALPVTPRDYYLSKAFQFAYSVVVIRYFPECRHSDGPRCCSLSPARCIDSNVVIRSDKYPAGQQVTP